MSPVKSRREQYSDETRAALLDAATRRFAEHGFAKTSLEDVATDIRATRGAVYHHFPNKTALFEAVFHELESEMIRRVTEVAAGETDPWQAAMSAVRQFLDGSCDPVYGRIVWQEAPIALGWRRWRECEEKYAYGLIEQTIQSLMESGDMPDLPLEPVSHITFHILGAAGMALAEAPPDEKTRVRDEYARAIRHILNGARLPRT
ncbi:TetR/AcrR family transcriptional regulator [Actinomadura rudentiformis]|uniref:TetR/AcrR family transcriptional regulator n=1 Tax=Actinomadura rudentiformis TaxID=359158 RepID=A0A6H9Z721_9ACTN|nr:TetR/AcrR family transcriptional regulator [Actinomadura rudentiformis]KAB2349595.1 TetR/AcrR family transcriptional regulator [Actinomadura rudentiformis]